MTPIISVENLAKAYMIGHSTGPRDRYTALRDVIGRSAKNTVLKFRDLIRGRQLIAGGAREEFWALNDVSFDVQPGEVLGIIGRNGAGKSTLLKILSRITEPTRGRVTLRGRVASLLEVGTGFHPELSGRENIYLNGAILGMKRREIQRKFDDIVQFAEVEKFLDTPVKRYSSGMYVRLAFAVAAHLEPEVLVVDEVLAVGDVDFQRKCLGKMRDVGRSGRTVLLVSHHMPSILNLCNRTLLLQGGAVRAVGQTNDVVSCYLREHSELTTEYNVNLNEKVCAKGEPFFKLSRFSIDNLDGTSCSAIRADSDAKIKVSIEGFVSETDVRFNLGLALLDESGNCLMLTFSTDQPEKDWPNLEPGRVNRIEAMIDTCVLNEGSFSLHLLSSLHCVRMIWTTEDNISVGFEIAGNRGGSPYWTSKRNSILAPKIPWHIVSSETQP